VHVLETEKHERSFSFCYNFCKCGATAFSCVNVSTTQARVSLH